MNISVDVTQQDIEEHYSDVWKRVEMPMWIGVGVNIVAWTLVLIVFFVFFGKLTKSHIALFVLMVVTYTLSDVLGSRFLKNRILKLESNSEAGPRALSFDDSGVHYKNDLVWGTVTWNGVVKVDETNNLIRLFVGAYEAILVPKRQVSDLNAFRSLLAEHKGQ